MEFKNESFESLKNSKNPEEINDFLIEIGKLPSQEDLIFIDFIIKNFESSLLDQIKINLIWVLGEIGEHTDLADKYFDYLFGEYNKSDRWIRNEILKSLDKLTINKEYSNEIFELVGNALSDDYLPVKLEALNFLLKFDSLPNRIIRVIFQILNTADGKIAKYCEKVLRKFIKNEKKLIELLNSSDSYKILKERGIRSILVSVFQIAFELESFRELILNSKWEENYKNLFLREINTYQRIILKDR